MEKSDFLINNVPCHLNCLKKKYYQLISLRVNLQPSGTLHVYPRKTIQLSKLISLKLMI